MEKKKTSIVFTGDIGFDRYMDHRWEDEHLLLSPPSFDFSTALITLSQMWKRTDRREG